MYSSVDDSYDIKQYAARIKDDVESILKLRVDARTSEELTALKEQHSRLFQHFLQYAKHELSCSLLTRPDSPCTCGLNDAIREFRG